MEAKKRPSLVSPFLDHEELLDGAREFNKEEHVPNKEFFESLKEVQVPHTLFIGCSDSRVIPNLLTRSKAGELFVVRNIANLVPAYESYADDMVATAAVIEYAVLHLNVQSIVVCGHSNCGGCAAIYDEAELNQLPHTKKWLELARPVRVITERRIANGKLKLEDKAEYSEKLNVILQLRHLMKYPYIRERVTEGKLTLFGWYYNIEQGHIYNYDQSVRRFVRIE